MIFAPRSCPSRPGFAITTRNLRPRSKYRNVKLTVIGSSPAWPNPGSAHAGHLVESDGDRSCSTAAPACSVACASARSGPASTAIAITHFHLDHWGDLVPWVWGELVPCRQERPASPSCGSSAGARAPGAPAGRSWGSRTCSRSCFDLQEYDADTPFVAGGLRGDADPRSRTTPSRRTAFRVERRRGRARVLRRLGPAPRSPSVARDADLFICEATLLDGSATVRHAAT